MVKKGVLREWEFWFSLGLCKGFSGVGFLGDFEWFLWDEKKRFWTKGIIEKLVVFLYTLFKGSLFFLFWLKKVLRDGWVWVLLWGCPEELHNTLLGFCRDFSSVSWYPSWENKKPHFCQNMCYLSSHNYVICKKLDLNFI